MQIGLEPIASPRRGHKQAPDFAAAFSFRPDSSGVHCRPPSKPAALPFNSSTPILWYKADHFKAAGFEKPGETWQEVDSQLRAIKEKGVSDCSMVLANDFFWSMLENYAAIQD